MDNHERRLIGDVESRFLTLKQVSKHLNVGGPQVYTLVRSGVLPAIKLGGRGIWRVDRRDLDDYIRRATEETQEWVRRHPLNKKATAKGGEPWGDESTP